MSRTKIRKTLHATFSKKFVASRVSKALRNAYAELPTAIKWIERITGVKAQTASKWYRGINAPNSGHLLHLAIYYPEILEVICEMIGRTDAWQAIARQHIPELMKKTIQESHPNHRFRGDKFVTPKSTSGTKIHLRFNQRQRWFLEKLQQGYRLHAKDIVIVWDVHKRTAKRDIAGLVSAGLIIFNRSEKIGRYSIK